MVLLGMIEIQKPRNNMEFLRRKWPIYPHLLYDLLGYEILDRGHFLNFFYTCKITFYPSITKVKDNEYERIKGVAK